MNNSSYGLSEEAKKDSRQKLWKKQRKERGFDDTELWNLFHHIAEYIAPRIKAFRDNEKFGHPASLSPEAWQEILTKITYSFEKIVEDNLWFLDEEENKKIEEGLDLFREWYLNLWD